MAELRSADLLVKNILSNHSLLETIKEDPQKVLKQQAAIANETVRALEGDIWIYRLVVSFLGALAILVACGIIAIIVINGKTPSEGLVALGSAAVGSLAGLLAPTPGR